MQQFTEVEESFAVKFAGFWASSWQRARSE
jgi:hypothetical protein